MNRLKAIFKTGNQRLLNIYFTAGYPLLNSTAEVIHALQQHGADMIEIGIPYSDPVADGPMIQASNMQALANGMNLSLLFKQLEIVKKQVTVPVILMGYLNPVLQYGIESFCTDAVQAGIDAVILPDLPLIIYEKEYKKVFEKYRLPVIFLITPETSRTRIKKADRLSNGFLYAVSSSTVTGSDSSARSAPDYFKQLKEMKLRNRVMIGFGIKDHDGFENACRYASGAIVGSAYIRLLGECKDISEATKRFIASIKYK